MIIEINCQAHLVIKQIVFDYACVLQVIFYLVDTIWPRRNIWKFGSGGVGSNFILIRDIWNVRLKGFLISLREINKCKMLMRPCPIYKLAGTILDVSVLNLNINFSSIFVGRLHGCSVKCKYGNKRSKWFVRESMGMEAWYSYIGTIEGLGIFKSHIFGSREQYKVFYIYENIKLEL